MLNQGSVKKTGTGNACNWDKVNRENHPINCVSWNDLTRFAKWVGARLPSEAELEFAARGGEDYQYAGSNHLDEVRWYSSNAGQSTYPVGQKKANGYGLCDLSGNVWEWTADTWHKNYKGAPNNGSAWCEVSDCMTNTSHHRRVARGGDWNDYEGGLRVAFRYYNSPAFRSSCSGGRLARSVR